MLYRLRYSVQLYGCTRHCIISSPLTRTAAVCAHPSVRINPENEIRGVRVGEIVTILLLSGQPATCTSRPPYA